MRIKILFLFILFYSSLFALEPAIILLGPPGSGKGTFSQYLKRNYGYNHISIGDTLRREVEKETDLGVQISDKIKNGEYINPEIILVIIENTVAENQATGRPFILDGFGQNDGEVAKIREIFEKYGLMERALVVFLDAEDSTCQKRILNRRICSCCQEVYNTLTVQPKIPEICDFCGESLKIRLNDIPEVIIRRIKNYRENVQQKHKIALDLFPAISYDTSRPYEECILYYKKLAEKAHNLKKL